MRKKKGKRRRGRERERGRERRNGRGRRREIIFFFFFRLISESGPPHLRVFCVRFSGVLLLVVVGCCWLLLVVVGCCWWERRVWFIY